MQKPPEKVTWTDSGLQMTPGWADLSVYESAAREWTGTVTTIGMPIYEDDNVLVLGLSYDAENDNYYGAQLIAKNCVRSREVLQVAN